LFGKVGISAGQLYKCLEMSNVGLLLYVLEYSHFLLVKILEELSFAVSQNVISHGGWEVIYNEQTVLTRDLIRWIITYYIAGKFGEFGESSLICQTKTIQISTYNYNLLAESIHLPNIFSPNA